MSHTENLDTHIEELESCIQELETLLSGYESKIVDIQEEVSNNSGLSPQWYLIKRLYESATNIRNTLGLHKQTLEQLKQKEIRHGSGDSTHYLKVGETSAS